MVSMAIISPDGISIALAITKSGSSTTTPWSIFSSKRILARGYLWMKHVYHKANYILS